MAAHAQEKNIFQMDRCMYLFRIQTCISDIYKFSYSWIAGRVQIQDHRWKHFKKTHLTVPWFFIILSLSANLSLVNFEIMDLLKRPRRASMRNFWPILAVVLDPLYLVSFLGKLILLQSILKTVFTKPKKLKCFNARTTYHHKSSYWRLSAREN